MNAITLFSSAGIGDLAIKKCGVSILVANELLGDRASLHRRNFPETLMLVGDVLALQGRIVAATRERLCGGELDFLFATPPCQGMSKNGQGKLLQGIRAGRKPELDARNQLIIPTMEIVRALRPKTVVFENVPEMVNTVIADRSGNIVNVLDFIQRELGPEYAGGAEVVQFADFGVPQRRARLITIYSRDSLVKEVFSTRRSLIPERTHSKSPSGRLKPWVTVRDAIEALPKLDSKDKASATSDLPFHRVPVLDIIKYWWISSTPSEKGAFDNQCVNPECKFEGNLAHSNSVGDDGVNRASSSTPLYCAKCGFLLPRPATKDRKTGQLRIMSGYTSAYKRMRWDLPSSTLTTNMSYPCSDHKLHPDQNRVLSLLEAFKLHTLDEFQYVWEYDNNKPATDTSIREVIGESIPPRAIFAIVDYLILCTSGGARLERPTQLSFLR